MIWRRRGLEHKAQGRQTLRQLYGSRGVTNHEGQFQSRRLWNCQKKHWSPAEVTQSDQLASWPGSHSNRMISGSRLKVQSCCRVENLLAIPDLKIIKIAFSDFLNSGSIACGLVHLFRRRSVQWAHSSWSPQSWILGVFPLPWTSHLQFV